MTNLRASLIHHQALKQSLLQAFPQLAEDDKALADTLEGESDFNSVVVATVQSGKVDLMMAKVLKGRIEEMKQRAARLEARAEKLFDLVAETMSAADIKTIQAPEFTVTAAAGRSAVVIFDEAAIPPDYMTVPEPPSPKPNKALIAQAIKDGFAVAGCAFSNPRPHLVIRTT